MAEQKKLKMNEVSLQGRIKESKLKFNANAEKGNSYGGRLILDCGQSREITLEVFVGEKTSTGNIKKAFTVLDQIHRKEIEVGTVVSVWGNGDFTPKLEDNFYKNATGDALVENMRVSLGFGNIKVVEEEVADEDLYAQVDLELYVKSVDEEFVNDEPTGRAIVKGYVPTYNSILPITIVAGDVEGEDGIEEMGQMLLDEVQEGDTILAHCDLNFTKTTVTKGGGKGRFGGRSKTSTETSYQREITMMGGDFVENNGFDSEDIKAQLETRKKAMEDELAKEDNNSNATSSGSARKGGFGSRNKETATAPKEEGTTSAPTRQRRTRSWE